MRGNVLEIARLGGHFIALLLQNRGEGGDFSRDSPSFANRAANIGVRGWQNACNSCYSPFIIYEKQAADDDNDWDVWHFALTIREIARERVRSHREVSLFQRGTRRLHREAPCIRTHLQSRTRSASRGVEPPWVHQSRYCFAPHRPPAVTSLAPPLRSAHNSDARNLGAPLSALCDVAAAPPPSRQSLFA